MIAIHWVAAGGRASGVSVTDLSEQEWTLYWKEMQHSDVAITHVTPMSEQDVKKWQFKGYPPLLKQQLKLLGAL